MKQLFENLIRPLFNLEDYLFEIRYSVNFGKLLSKDLLNSPYSDSISHATAYDPIWCRNLRDIFNFIKINKIDLTNFIDIGCGMGKPCFYAYLKYPFKLIMGIDFSPKLIIEAKKNLSKTNIIINCEDAQVFKIPNGNSLIFLYNPFDEVIFGRFIENNIQHFKNNKSYLAYAQDNHRNLLIRNGFKCVYRNSSQALSIYEFILS